MQMDEFLNAYDSLKEAEDTRIEQASNEVIRMLELISTNSTRLDLSTQIIDMDYTGLQSKENASASELKECMLIFQENVRRHLYSLIFLHLFS